MFARVRVATIIFWFSAIASASTFSPKPGTEVKVDGELIVMWDSVSTVAADNQVTVLDKGGRVIVSIGVLRLSPEAKEVSIYDVAISSQSTIAVAAVYSKGRGIRPVSTLLLFDRRGSLQSAFALAASREIRRLTFAGENIWTMTLSDGDLDPTSVPLLVEYGPDGKSIRELLPRDQFPPHERVIDEPYGAGAVAFGYDAGTIWFWLPVSTDFVEVDVVSGKVNRRTTGLPQGSDLRRLTRLKDGELLAEMVVVGSGGPRELRYYVWDATTQHWTPRRPSEHCMHAALIGEYGPTLLFFTPGSTSSTGLCYDNLSQ